MIIAGLLAATSLLTADFGAGIFTTGDIEWSAANQLRELSMRGNGGITLTPEGAMKYVPVGQPRYIEGLGVQVEPPARNKQTFATLSPVSTDGWFIPSSAAAGSSLTRINAWSSLYDAQTDTGAYIFRDLMDQGQMNGWVIRVHNASTTTNLTVQARGTTGSTGVRHSYSGYVYCEAGSGNLSMFGGGGSSGTFFDPYWRRAEGSGTPLDQPRPMNLVVHPQSTVWIIATQLEEGSVTTSPIPGGQSRVDDIVEIVGRHLLSGPCTIRIGLYMARRDNVRRQIMTFVADRGQTIEVMRHEDNSLSGIQAGEQWRAGVARLWGGGHMTIVLRTSPEGWTVGVGQLLGHNPFPAIPSGQRLRIGAAADGSAPLNGWITSIEIDHEVEDGDLRIATGAPLSADILDARRYVDDVDGDDSADGRTPATAWRTLDRVSATDASLAVPARAHVFFRRGGLWAEELVPQHYATFTAYGEGDLPTIGAGQLHAVQASGMTGFRLENLRFKGSTQRGCNFFGRSAVQLSDVEVVEVGSLADRFSIGIACRATATSPANDFYIRRVLIRDIDALVTQGGAGDNLYIERIGGRIRVIGCNFQTPVGNDADCFQVSSSHPGLLGDSAADVFLSATSHDQKTKFSLSGKGTAVIQARTCTVIGNYFNGINFCLGVDSPVSKVHHNLARGARLNPYSWGFGIGGRIDTISADWQYNVVDDCSRGIAISANGTVALPEGGTRPPFRADLFIRRFRIMNCATAIFVDRPSSGRIFDSVILDCPVVDDDRTGAMTPPIGRLYSDLKIQYLRVS